jgi:hypothetical protein
MSIGLAVAQSRLNTKFSVSRLAYRTTHEGLTSITESISLDLERLNDEIDNR